MFLPTIWNYTKCIIGYVALLHHLAVSQRSNFSPVKTCTTLTLREIPVAVFDNCTGPGLVIHCLPDSTDNLGLSCYPPRWISPGKCPYYNTYQGNMDEKDCNSKYGNCPKGQFRSPLSVMYDGCYIKEERIITTTEALTTTEAMIMKTTTCEPVKSNCSTLVSAAEEGKSTSCTGEIVACIVLAVFIVLLLVVLLLKFTRVATYVPCLHNSGPDNNESQEVDMPLQGEPN